MGRYIVCTGLSILQTGARAKIFLSGLQIFSPKYFCFLSCIEDHAYATEGGTIFSISFMHDAKVGDAHHEITHMLIS